MTTAIHSVCRQRSPPTSMLPSSTPRRCTVLFVLGLIVTLGAASPNVRAQEKKDQPKIQPGVPAPELLRLVAAVERAHREALLRALEQRPEVGKRVGGLADDVD